MMTAAARIAENEARAKRNEERARRRQLGNDDVTEDEPLLDLNPEENEQPRVQRHASFTARTNTGPLEQGLSTEVMADLLTAAAQCSPDVYERTLACVEQWSGVSATAGRSGQGTRELKDRKGSRQRIGDRQGPDLFDRRQVDADPKLRAVLELGFHLPLTLCTSEALEAVAHGTKELTMTTYDDKDHKKRRVVNVRLWPSEEDMAPDEWRDAWLNYLEILEDTCETVVHERFKQHYEYLSRQANFTTRFPGILRFDIALRRAYFVNAKHQSFVVGSARYCQELTQSCTDQAAELVERSYGPDHAARSSPTRYHPYRYPGR